MVALVLRGFINWSSCQVGPAVLFVKEVINLEDLILLYLRDIVLPSVAILLSIIAIILTIRADKKLRGIALSTTYTDDPWIECARLLQSAREGDHYYAINIMIPWDRISDSVKKFEKANIIALNRGVYITRIFCCPSDASNPNYYTEVKNEIERQKAWGSKRLSLLVYSGNKGVNNCGIVVQNGKPTHAVMWIYDSLHPASKLSGFHLYNDETLRPLYDNYIEIENQTKTADEFSKSLSIPNP